MFFKSSKVIPVMIMRIILLKKRYQLSSFSLCMCVCVFLSFFVCSLRLTVPRHRYGLWDYVAAVMLATGLAMFTLADAHVSPKWNPTGMFFVCQSNASLGSEENPPSSS